MKYGFSKYFIIMFVSVILLLLGVFLVISYGEDAKAAKFFAQVQHTYRIGEYQRVFEFIPKGGPFKYCIFVGTEQHSRHGQAGLVCSTTKP